MGSNSVWKFSENSSDLVVPPFPKRCRRKCENHSIVKFDTFCPTNETYLRGEKYFSRSTGRSGCSGRRNLLASSSYSLPNLPTPNLSKSTSRTSCTQHMAHTTQHTITLSHTICNTLSHTITLSQTTYYHTQHTITHNVQHTITHNTRYFRGSLGSSYPS